MGTIEESRREKFFPAPFWGEDINTDFRKILGHSVIHDGLGIPEPLLSEESEYNTSNVAIRELVDSLLGGSNLNYIGHRACVRKASLAARRSKMHVKLGELARQKELAGGQEGNRIHRKTRNGVWFSYIPHRLNGREFSW